MKHVMLDLEFLGKPPLARLATIGAVFFDPTTGELGARFYARVAWTEESDQSLPFEASTVAWWMEQEPAAVAEMVAKNDRHHIGTVLHEFTQFIGDQAQIWGNGSDCDCVILAGAYKSMCSPVPWAFWNTRDVRTVVQLAKDLRGVDVKKKTQFNGVKHNALDDAIYQAQYVSLAYSLLG